MQELGSILVLELQIQIGHSLGQQFSGKTSIFKAINIIPDQS